MQGCTKYSTVFQKISHPDLREDRLVTVMRHRKHRLVTVTGAKPPFGDGTAPP